MTKVEFTIRYQCTNDDGAIGVWVSYNTVDYIGSDTKKKLIDDFSSYYKKDLNFKIINIDATPNCIGTMEIDWVLLERMQAVRDMCDLGRKVRVNTGIRNRQPLRKAFIAFADKSIQDYMVYIDCKTNEFKKILEDELNILNITFIDEKITKDIFNYNIKPNFRILGPKGFGKQAQSLKNTLQAMTVEQKNELHTKLCSNEIVMTDNIPLGYADVEIEFTPKENLTSSTGKVGAVVLDVGMDEFLLNLGFIAEFRSAVQSLRKEMNLELTDKIFLEVFCEDKRASVLNEFSSKFLKILLATDIKFSSLVNSESAHQLFFHNEVLRTEKQVMDLCSQAKLDKQELSKELMYVKILKDKTGVVYS